jgi:cytochrome c biogenesis protein CcmG/thiol:disulfide interchange protein DsbE
MTRAAAFLFGISLLLVAGLAAAGGARPPEALALSTPKEPVAAPTFDLPDLEGKTLRFGSLRGKRVFLNFFATWCGPCREEMPAMERLHRLYRERGLAVLAVDVRESAKTVRDFVRELKLTFPVVLDDDGTLSLKYGVRALPVSFLVNRDGLIVWRAIGSRPWESKPAQEYFANLVGGPK